MNARSKADFINSVAGGMIPCPNCQKLNEPDSKFCEACGTRLLKPEEPKPAATPAFEPVKKAEPAAAPAFEPVKKVEPAETLAFEPVKKAEPAVAPAFEPVKKAEPVVAPAFEPVKKVEPAVAPAFEPVKKAEPAVAPALEPVKNTEVRRKEVYQEPKSVFAKGLPDWDMVPPQVMVRRKKR